jgi:hypothetical protein
MTRKFVMKLLGHEQKNAAYVEERPTPDGVRWVVWTGPLDEKTDELDFSFPLTRANLYSDKAQAILYAKDYAYWRAS